MPAPLQAIVFDFDGVVTNGIPFHDQAYQWVFQQHHVEVNLNYLHSTIGMTPRQVLRQIWQEFGVASSAEEAVEEHRAFLHDLYQQHATLAPGLVEFLQTCRQRGLRLGLASATYSECLDIVLQKHNIHNYFESIVGGDMLSKGKPDPEMISKALKHMDMDPSVALAIDDARSGILAAQTLVMRTVAYLQYSQKEITEADQNVQNFSEIVLDL